MRFYKEYSLQFSCVVKGEQRSLVTTL